ncbi:hypothetical protein YB2330_002074 [Saitoella coloradoensis]
MAPVVFTGLFVTLYAFKSLSMVVFQSSLIYMRSVPPGARQETVEMYASECRSIKWEEVQFKTRDGKTLAACIGKAEKNRRLPKALMVYFQGNAGSAPARLPFLSQIITSTKHVDLTVFAPSYRGYWHSTGRPSEAGLQEDARASLQYARERWSGADVNSMFIWGHSVGAAVAAHAAAADTSPSTPISPKAEGEGLALKGMILETPFTDIPDMLRTLYPQKWLPYKHLVPFLRSSWNNRAALQRLGENAPNFPLLIVEAGRDEIVPTGMAGELEGIAKEAGVRVERVVSKKGLHMDVAMKGEFRDWIGNFMRDCINDKADTDKLN